jgi:hypothetical protein
VLVIGPRCGIDPGYIDPAVLGIGLCWPIPART